MRRQTRARPTDSTRRSTSLSSLRAEFRQVVTAAGGGRTESAEGSVSLARPGRFRWDYRVPAQLIVSDGTTVWLYDEDLAQVTVRPAADSLAGTPALLLSGQANLAGAFEISDGGEEGGLAWSRLRPKDADSDFTELRVGVSGKELRRMTLLDKLGQTTELEFSRIERNPRFDADTFTLRAAAGRRRRRPGDPGRRLSEAVLRRIWIATIVVLVAAIVDREPHAATGGPGRELFRQARPLPRVPDARTGGLRHLHAAAPVAGDAGLFPARGVARAGAGHTDGASQCGMG